MSYENIGKTGATAVVSNYGGNFPINGADPAVIIEAAWAYVAGLGGGNIFLDGAGERWTTASQIDSQGSNVVLHGGGVGAPEIYLGNGLDTDIINIGNLHENIYLGYLDLNGNWTNQTRDDSGGGETATSRGIRNLGENVHVYKSYLHEIAQHAITFAQCVGGTAHHNYVSYIGWNGIFTYRLPISHGIGIQIHDNHIEHCSDVGAGCYGHRTNIHHNYIHDIDQSFGANEFQWGIGIESGDYNQACNNTIDNVQAGIVTGWPALEDPQHFLIDGNIISGLTNAEGGGHGIYVNGRNCVVSNNIIDEVPAFVLPWGVGIMVDTGANNVKIHGNSINGFGTGDGFVGIRVATEDDISIDDNEVHGLTYSGIQLNGSCNRIKMRNNVIYDGLRGIYFDDVGQSDDCLISGNYIHSMSLYGINAQNTDDLHVIGNVIRDCAVGIDMSNANSVRTVLDSNDFFGCTNDVDVALATNPLYGGNKNQAGLWIENLEP